MNKRALLVNGMTVATKDGSVWTIVERGPHYCSLEMKIPSELEVLQPGQRMVVHVDNIELFFENDSEAKVYSMPGDANIWAVLSDAIPHGYRWFFTQIAADTFAAGLNAEV